MENNNSLKQRLDFNQIDDATGALLRRHKDFIIGELPALLDGFYAHVARYSEAAALFKNRPAHGGRESMRKCVTGRQFSKGGSTKPSRHPCAVSERRTTGSVSS